MVGLNSDRSVKNIKGNSRPVNRDEDRARVLAALACVDFVILFDSDTPLELIQSIVPDVLIKGGDWPEEKIVGRDTVKQAGGRVLSIDLLPGYSTTDLIDRIKHG
jgi:rfaE bifunctional protein nucleotidyltransferase chain/domain